MALDGIWTGELYGVYGWESTGILILEKGRVLGGGNNHYSVGTYEESDDDVSLSFVVEYHGQVRTLFGESRRNISVNFEGKRDGSVIEGTLARPDRADMTVTCRLSKRADLSALPA
ncbi:MAG: hypothetical protein ACE5D3_04320 [Candidatus Binatia bacterium]